MHVQRSLKIAIASTLALVILQGVLSCLIMDGFRGAAVRLDPRQFALLLIAGACTVLGWFLAWNFVAEPDEPNDDQEEHQAGLILESVGEGVLSVDEAGTVIFANQAALSLLGYQDGELTGRDLRGVLHHDAAGYCSGCGKRSCLLNPGFSGESRWHCTNELLWRKDGSSFSADFSGTRLPGRDRGGFILAFRDVSGRREVEERLRLQGAALEAAASGIIIVSRQGKIQWANQALCRILGRSLDQILGMAPQALLVGEGEPEAWAGLAEDLAVKKAWHGVAVGRATGGSALERDVTVTPVLDEQGEVSHFVWSVLEVPEPRRIEEVFLSAKLRKEGNRPLTSSGFTMVEQAVELRAHGNA